MDMLRIGLSSLLTTQHSMSVSSNNIANSNTEGYARQKLVVGQPSSINIGGVYYGQGVYASDVKRIGSEYLETSLRNSKASHQFYESYYDLGVEIDKMLSDQDTGLDKTFQTLFTSLGDLANNPTSEATRGVVLDSFDALGGKFGSIANVIQLSRDTVDSDLVAFTDRLNSLASDLVSINEGLKDSKAKTGEFAAQLVDERYRVLSDMSELADMQVFYDEDGMASVYLGDGMALVANNKVTPIEARPNGFSEGEYEVYLRGAEISDQINGGKIGASLKYRTEVLDSSENQIGRLALGFTQMMNLKHQNGFTPSGVAGGSILADFSAVAQNHLSNGGTGLLTVSFNSGATQAAQEANMQALEARTYEVVDNGGTYDVYDADTGDVLLTGAGTSFSLEGLDFNLAGATAAGDSFKISPMAKAIDNYQLLITDTQDIANSQDPAGSISDNRNTMDLYDVQDMKFLNNGLDSLQGGYSTLVAGLGSEVASAEASMYTASALYDQAQLNRDTESGVNVEEEAANILALQQHYSAAAKVVAAAQSIFDDLINAVR
tara:strand:+ start:117891 stop:119537 length:1647 start_codon:yes stop_codon:yes gene_type:complete